MYSGVPDEQAAEGLVGRAGQDLGHPEVAELELPIGGHQHVGWLEVAMHDPLPVGIMDRPGQRQEPCRRPVGGLGLAVELRVEVPAVDVLQREVRHRRAAGGAAPFAEIEDLDDIGVLEPGDGLGLGEEPGAVAVAGELAAAGASSGRRPAAAAHGQAL